MPIGQRRQIPLKQKSQELGSHLNRVLGAEPKSSESTVHAFKRPVISPASDRYKIILFEPGVIEHAYNSSTGEMEAGG